MTLFYHTIYRAVSFLHEIPITNVHAIFKTTNILLSSITTLTLYLLLEKLFKNKIIPLASVLIFFTKDAFLTNSSTIMTETLFLFTLVLSLYLLKTGLDSKKTKQVYTSAILFGISTSIREQIIFFLPWYFIIFLISEKSFKKAFNNKVTIISLTVLILSSLIVPIFLLLKDGHNYLQNITSYVSLNNSLYVSLPLFYKIKSFLLDIPIVILVVFILGIFKLTKHNKLLATLAILPFTFTIFLVMPKQRLYLPLWLLISPLSAYVFFELLESLYIRFNLKKRISIFVKQNNLNERSLINIIFIYSVGIYAIAQIIIYSIYIHPKYKKETIYNLNYRTYLLNEFPNEDVLFLVGKNSWLIESHIQPFFKSNWKVIPSGWSWPTQEAIEKSINYHLENDHLVILDPVAYLENPSKEIETISNIIKIYNISPYKGSTFQITNKQTIPTH